MAKKIKSKSKTAVRKAGTAPEGYRAVRAMYGCKGCAFLITYGLCQYSLNERPCIGKSIRGLPVIFVKDVHQRVKAAVCGLGETYGLVSVPSRELLDACRDSLRAAMRFADLLDKNTTTGHKLKDALVPLHNWIVHLTKTYK